MTPSRFPAMGTTIEVWCDTPDDGPVVDWFQEVEQACSRFRPDSELSRINRDMSDSITVSALMWEVLTAADRARRMTDGLVDAGVGSAVAGWGYDRTFTEVAEIGSPPSNLSRPDWALRPERRALVRSHGTQLDLGGIAKGWTCDRAVEEGMAGVVSAGGDMRSADPRTVVSILDDRGEPAARLKVGEGALATSSATRRRWRAGGREVSHLMDPRTMTPVESPVLSATVVAESAVDAEIGAKAVLLLGAGGLAWADSRDWIRSALVLWHDGSVFATIGTEVAA